MQNKEDVITTLRSVLISSKRAIPLDKLQSEYRLLIGSQIPFRDLGFRNLESYLKSIPEVVVLNRNAYGDYVCSPVATSPIAHIARMVHSQRSSRSAMANVRHRPIHSRTNFIPPSRTMMRSSTPPAPPHPNMIKDVPTSISRSLEQVPNSTSLSKRKVKVLAKPGRGPSQEMRTVEGVKKQEEQPPPTSRTVYAAPQKTLKATRQTRPAPKRDALMDYVIQNHLGSVSFKTTSMKSKNGIVCYFSIVKVDGRTFTSYPTEKPSKEGSEEEAARCALEDLKAQFKGGNPSGLPVSSVECFTRRLFDLVSDKTNGLWASHIFITYANMYEETLPSNWVAIIETDPRFKIERTGDTNTKVIIYPNIIQNTYTVLRRFSDTSDTSASDYSDSSTPTVVSPPPLILPSVDFFDVYITQVNSASDMYIRLFGENYSDKFESLATDMELYYMEYPLKNHPPLQPAVGDLYAAKVDETWHRVEVQESISDDTVRCLFVDHGDVDNLNVSIMVPLEPQFRYLPFQALKCKLTGLEGLSDNTFNVDLLKLIVGKSFYALIDSREEVMSLTLYDTSTDVDKDINKLVMEMSLENMQGPKLKSLITDVYLSHVSSTCELYIQIHIFHFAVLEKYIAYAATKCCSVNKLVEPGQMYLVRRTADQRHYRSITLKDPDPDGNVTVSFVDYGNTDVVNLTDVLAIHSEFKLLKTVPYQALKCRLNGLPTSLEWNVKSTERLKSLVPDDVSLLAKLISKSNIRVPLVELFKRLPETNELVSINQTLLLGEDLSGIDDAQTNEEATSDENGKDISTSNISKTVKLPTIGEYCDIHITWSASPFNFMFQMWVGGEAFDKLMYDMQEYYGKKKLGKQVTVEQVKNREFYAALYDGIWYRVSATANEYLLQHKMVPVYFMDFGDHNVVELNDMCSLEVGFKQVPSQGLRGQLADIAPVNGDWQAEDCMRFKELVDAKTLVALPRSYTKNVEGDTCITMELVDTSKPNIDYHINKILVEEQRAYYVNKKP